MGKWDVINGDVLYTMTGMEKNLTTVSNSQTYLRCSSFDHHGFEFDDLPGEVNRQRVQCTASYSGDVSGPRALVVNLWDPKTLMFPV